MKHTKVLLLMLLGVITFLEMGCDATSVTDEDITVTKQGEITLQSFHESLGQYEMNVPGCSDNGQSCANGSTCKDRTVCVKWEESEGSRTCGEYKSGCLCSDGTGCHNEPVPEAPTGITPENKGGISSTQAGVCYLSWNQTFPVHRDEGQTKTISVTPSQDCDPVDRYEWEFQNHSGGWSVYTSCTGSSCNDDPFNGQNGGYNVSVIAYDFEDNELGDSGVREVIVTDMYSFPRITDSGTNYWLDHSSNGDNEEHWCQDYSNEGDLYFYTEVTESRSKWQPRADWTSSGWLLWDDYENGLRVREIHCGSRAP